MQCGAVAGGNEGHTDNRGRACVCVCVCSVLFCSCSKWNLATFKLALFSEGLYLLEHLNVMSSLLVIIVCFRVYSSYKNHKEH